MNILKVSILFAIFLNCVAASESGVADDVIKALSLKEYVLGFKSINNEWERWGNRKDLFDHVVTKEAWFIARFINQVKDLWLKRYTLTTLSIKKPEIFGKVLEKIKCDDSDLASLTMHRPELAEYHETFFNVIDTIKDPKYQTEAVGLSVSFLIRDGRYASVDSLIHALENRQFKSGNLKNVAVQMAFDQGAAYNVEYFVKKFHYHPAITHGGYAKGLCQSCTSRKWTIFQFLVSQADQGDLEKAKKEGYIYGEVIDKALETALPAGARHGRLVEVIKLAITTLDSVTDLGVWGQEPGKLITHYLVDGQGAWAKVMKSIMEERETPRILSSVPKLLQPKVTSKTSVEKETGASVNDLMGKS